MLTRSSGFFEDARVLVGIPSKIAKTWCNTDEINFDANQVIDDGMIFKILQ